MNKKSLFYLVAGGLLLIILGVSIGRYTESVAYETFLKDFMEKYRVTSSEISSIKSSLKYMDQDLYTLKFKQDTILLAVRGDDEDEDEDADADYLLRATPTPYAKITPSPVPKRLDDGISTPTEPVAAYSPEVMVTIPEPTINPTPIVSTVCVDEREEVLPELSAEDIQKLIKLLELIN